MTPLMAFWPYQALFYFLGIVSGALIHHTTYIHGEWHIQAPNIIRTHTAISFCLALGTSFTQSTCFEAIFRTATSMFWGYLLGVIISITVYRVFFHPLTRTGFPGPWYAPISKIWHVWAARSGQNHLVLAALHQKYGDFVRTGMYHEEYTSRWSLYRLFCSEQSLN